MKVYIKKELNPFHNDEIEWTFRIPELKLKFYHPQLQIVLDKLKYELEKGEIVK